MPAACGLRLFRRQASNTLADTPSQRFILTDTSDSELLFVRSRPQHLIMEQLFVMNTIRDSWACVSLRLGTCVLYA